MNIKNCDYSRRGALNFELGAADSSHPCRCRRAQRPSRRYILQCVRAQVHSGRQWRALPRASERRQRRQLRVAGP